MERAVVEQQVAAQAARSKLIRVDAPTVASHD